MAVAQHQIKILITAIDQFSRTMSQAGSQSQRIGQAMKTMGASMTRNVTLPLAALGVAGVKAFMDVETAMANIQTVGKQTGPELDNLRQTLFDMSTNIDITTASIDELTQSFYDIQGAGFEGTDTLKVLAVAAQAGSAGLTTTMAAAEGVTAALNSFGLEAENAQHIGDLMFRTVDRGVGTFEELSHNISKVAPTAAVMNISLEEMFAGMAALSKQTNDFAEAGTWLNRTMMAFINPTDAMKSVIQQLGWASGQAMIDQIGFAESLKLVSAAVGGNSEAMLELFGDMRAFKGAVALTGDAAELFAEDIASMGDVAGATAQAYAIQSKTLQSSLKSLSNSFYEFRYVIGEALAPVIQSVATGIKGIIDIFNMLPNSIQTTIVGFLALLAAVGPVMWIGGQFVSSWGALVGLFSKLPGLINGVQAAMSILAANPIMIAILGGVLLVGLLDSMGVLDDITKAVKAWFSQFGKMLSEGAKQLVRIGAILMEALWEGIKAGAEALWNGIKSVGKKIVDGIKGVFKIGSPSKVMLDIGGTLGSSLIGGLVGATNLSGAAGGMVSGVSGAAVGAVVGGGGVGVTVNIGTINVPPGTTKEQVDIIVKEVGKRMQRRGQSGRSHDR